jgi:hypothetical protein
MEDFFPFLKSASYPRFLVDDCHSPRTQRSQERAEDATTAPAKQRVILPVRFPSAWAQCCLRTAKSYDWTSHERLSFLPYCQWRNSRKKSL